MPTVPPASLQLQLNEAAMAIAPTEEPVAIGKLWVNPDTGAVLFSQGIPPVITAQPEDVNVNPGDVATFSVTATNATSYQWQLDSGAGFANIVDAVAGSYQPPAFTIGNAGDQYRCVVTGPGGETTSDVASVLMDLYAETTAYAARFPTYSQTLSDEGYGAVNRLFATVDSAGVTMTRGWLMGNKWNLTGAAHRVLELCGTTNDFTHSDQADSTLHVGGGTLCLEGDTALKGYLGLPEPLFTNDDWSILLMLAKPTRDSSATTGTAETSLLLSQYDSFAAGRFYIEGSFTSGLSITNVSGTNAISIKTTGIGPVAPSLIWITYETATRTMKCYDAFTGAQLGLTSTVAAGGFAAVNCRIGQPQRAVSVPPRVIQFGGIFKFSGVLDSTQRSNVFAGFYPELTLFNNQVLIYGNSVTSGNNANIDTKASDAWPIKFGVWAAKNNCWHWMPTSMGGKDLYYFRPSDYTPPTATSTRLGTLAARDAVYAVDVLYTNKRINLVVFDDNQNTAASVSWVPGASSDMLYEDFQHIIGAIVDKLRNVIPDLKVVCGTQLALQAADLVSPYNAYTYAQVAALAHRNNLRDWSQQIRVDDAFDAVYDLYTDSNQGWDVGDDGDAIDPENDLPNGKPTWFITDPQHPRSFGHNLMAIGFEAAVDEVRRP